eukprot:9590717-Prorocentrum_lima.AAC.1
MKVPSTEPDHGSTTTGGGSSNDANLQRAEVRQMTHPRQMGGRGRLCSTRTTPTARATPWRPHVVQPRASVRATSPKQRVHRLSLIHISEPTRLDVI